MKVEVFLRVKGKDLLEQKIAHQGMKHVIRERE